MWKTTVAGPERRKKEPVKMMNFILLVVTVISSTAFAGSGGDQFADIWIELSEWLKGTPGKILALLALGASFVNVLKQNFMAALGAFVSCLLMASGVNIIEGFLNAGI